MGATNSKVSENYALRQPAICDARTSLRLRQKIHNEIGITRDRSLDTPILSPRDSECELAAVDLFDANFKNKLEEKGKCVISVPSLDNSRSASPLRIEKISDLRNDSKKNTPSAFLNALNDASTDLELESNLKRNPVLPLVYSPFTVFHAEHKDLDGLVTIFSYAEKDLFPTLKDSNDSKSPLELWKLFMGYNQDKKPLLKKNSSQNIKFNEGSTEKDKKDNNIDKVESNVNKPKDKSSAFVDIIGSLAPKLRSFISVPGIIRFIDFQAAEDDVLVVTEPVLPLRVVLPFLTQEEISSGLYHLLETLNIIHKKGLAHGNVQLDSIYIRLRKSNSHTSFSSSSPVSPRPFNSSNTNNAINSSGRPYCEGTEDLLKTVQSLMKDYYLSAYPDKDTEFLSYLFQNSEKKDTPAIFKDPRVIYLRSKLDLQQHWALFGIELLQEVLNSKAEIVSQQSGANCGPRPLAQLGRATNLYLIFTDPKYIPKEVLRYHFKDLWIQMKHTLESFTKSNTHFSSFNDQKQLLITKYHPLIQRDLYMLGILIRTITKKYTEDLPMLTPGGIITSDHKVRPSAFPWYRIQHSVELLTAAFGCRESVESILNGPFFSESIYLNVMERFLNSIRSINNKEKPSRFVSLAVEIRYLSNFTLEKYVLPNLLTPELLAETGCEWFLKELFTPLEYLKVENDELNNLQIGSRIGATRLSYALSHLVVDENEMETNGNLEVNTSDNTSPVNSSTITITVTKKRLGNNNIVSGEELLQAKTKVLPNSSNITENIDTNKSNKLLEDVQNKLENMVDLDSVYSPLSTIQSVNKSIYVVRGVLKLSVYDRLILPFIIESFSNRTYHVRLTLLRMQSFYLGPLVTFDPHLLQSIIIPELLYGLKEKDPEIHSLSLSALLFIVPDLFKLETSQDPNCNSQKLSEKVSELLCQKVEVNNKENDNIDNLINFLKTGKKLNNKNYTENGEVVDNLNVDKKCNLSNVKNVKSFENRRVSINNHFSDASNVIKIKKKTSLANIFSQELDDAVSVSSVDSNDSTFTESNYVRSSKGGKLPRVNSISIAAIIDKNKPDLISPSMDRNSFSSKSPIYIPSTPFFENNHSRKSSINGHWSKTTWEKVASDNKEDIESDSSNERNTNVQNKFPRTKVYLPKETGVIDNFEFNDYMKNLSNLCKDDKPNEIDNRTEVATAFCSSITNDLLILTLNNQLNNISNSDINIGKNDTDLTSNTPAHVLKSKTNNLNPIVTNSQRNYLLTVQLPKFISASINKRGHEKLNDDIFKSNSKAKATLVPFNPYNALLFDIGNDFTYYRKYRLINTVTPEITAEATLNLRNENDDADFTVNQNIRTKSVNEDYDNDIVLQTPSTHTSPNRIVHSRVRSFDARIDYPLSPSEINRHSTSMLESNGLGHSKRNSVHFSSSSIIGSSEKLNNTTIRCKTLLEDYIVPHILAISVSRDEFFGSNELLREGTDILWYILSTLSEVWKLMITFVEVSTVQDQFNHSILNKHLSMELKVCIDSLKKCIFFIIKSMDPVEKIQFFCENILSLRENVKCHHINESIKNIFINILSESIQQDTNSSLVKSHIVERRFVVNASKDPLFSTYIPKSMDFGLGYVKDKCSVLRDFFSFGIINSLVEIENGFYSDKDFSWGDDGIDNILEKVNYIGMRSTNSNKNLWDLNKRTDLTMCIKYGHCSCNLDYDNNINTEIESIDDYKKIVTALQKRSDFSDVLLARESVIKSIINPSSKSGVPFFDFNERLDDLATKHKIRKTYIKLLNKVSDKSNFPVVGQKKHVRILSNLI